MVGVMQQKRTIVVLVDDIDGTEDARTVRFGLDGKGYAIELSEKNEAKLRKFLEPYVERARTDRKRKKRSSSRASSNGHKAKPPTAAEVRAWAAEAGVEVNEKGRVPQDVIDQYQSAQ